MGGTRFRFVEQIVAVAILLLLPVTGAVGAELRDEPVVWYENDGSETFSVQVVEENAYGARSVSALDVSVLKCGWRGQTRRARTHASLRRASGVETRSS